MKKIQVSIVGGSGYTGGELLRLLLFHPDVEILQVTSERFFGKYLYQVHPNLRRVSSLKFSAAEDLEACDTIFLCLPHGEAMQKIDHYTGLADRIVDLSSDFRLHDTELYRVWYKKDHVRPDLAAQFVYGIPEIYRDRIRTAKYVSGAGCNATATILALWPLYKADVVEPEKTVVEVKVGSSEAGNKVNEASHHPVRSGCVRSFMPTGHRHTAEILQTLGETGAVQVHFSATAIDMVRGVLATSHVFVRDNLKEKDIWKIYRDTYRSEPFIRIVKEREGSYRYPEPKLLSGTNYCDIGFELDESQNRLVVISAIDNLMKGSAGQAVQAFNLMHGVDETSGLSFPGLHPV